MQDTPLGEAATPAFIKKKGKTNEISPTTYFWALRAKCSVSSDWYPETLRGATQKGNNPKWNGKKVQENEECPECQCDKFIHKDSANLLEDYSIIR